MEARDVHLAQYVKQYRVLFPSSSIVLVNCRFADTVWSSVAARDTAPAMAPIHDILKDTPETNRPRLLIHTLSAGSCSLCHLYNHFSRLDRIESDTSRNVNGKELSLPLHASIFDSSPGVWSYKFNVDVMTSPVKVGWMRLLALPVAHLFAMTCWVLIRIVGVPDPQSFWSKAHNDKGSNKEVRRVYIYSKEDTLVQSSSVEAHAADAKEKGFDVQLEHFGGSGHIAHTRVDGDRYWRIVRDTWEDVSKL